MRKGRARRHFLITLSVFGVFLVLLIGGPVLLSFDPNATNLAKALQAPGENGFLLGSDAVGRDVLIRTIYGGQESVLLGFGVLAVSMVVGVIAGLVAGYFGGWIDYVVNKIVTAFQAFPSFVLAVAIAGILGQGMMNMMIAIAAVFWTQFTRLVRGNVMVFKQSDCLKAARMCGARTPAIFCRYAIPQIIGPVAIMGALSMSDIILTMAGLSFIGLGPERPTNEWGTMIAEAQPTFQYAIWCMIVPMVFLFIAVVLFNLLGDTLRDALAVDSEEVSPHWSHKRAGFNKKHTYRPIPSAEQGGIEAIALTQRRKEEG